MSQERNDEFALGEEIGLREVKYQRAKEMTGIDDLTAEEVAKTVDLPTPLVEELQAEKRAEDRDPEAFNAGRTAGRREMREILKDFARWAEISLSRLDAGSIERIFGCEKEEAEWVIGFIDSVGRSAVLDDILTPRDKRADIHVRINAAIESGRLFKFLVACRKSGKTKEVAVARMRRFLWMTSFEAWDYVDDNWDRAGEEAAKGAE